MCEESEIKSLSPTPVRQGIKLPESDDSQSHSSPEIYITNDVDFEMAKKHVKQDPTNPFTSKEQS